MLDLFSQLFDSARVMHSIGQPNANGTKSSAARFHSIGKRNTNCTKNACKFPASTHAIRLTRSMLLAFTWVFVTTRWIRSPMGEYRSGFYLLHRGLRFDSVLLRIAECQLSASICRNVPFHWKAEYQLYKQYMLFMYECRQVIRLTRSMKHAFM